MRPCAVLYPAAVATAGADAGRIRDRWSFGERSGGLIPAEDGGGPPLGGLQAEADGGRWEGEECGRGGAWGIGADAAGGAETRLSVGSGGVEFAA